MSPVVDAASLHRCHCGAVAEIGYPAEQGVKWLCAAHAPWQCVGCGPEAADEDHYPALQKDDEAKSADERILERLDEQQQFDDGGEPYPQMAKTEGFER